MREAIGQMLRRSKPTRLGVVAALLGVFPAVWLLVEVLASNVAEGPHHKGVVLARGHDCDMGAGMRLWAFQVEGHGVQRVRLELLYISAGQAQQIATGLYGELPPRFMADIHVLGVTGWPFVKGTGKSFTMGALFTPLRRGVWQRRWPKLPVAFALEQREDPSDATTLTEVGSIVALSAPSPPIQEMKLLQVLFTPDVKALPPGFGTQADLSVEEWQAFTKQRGEAILLARLICEDGPREHGLGHSTP